MAPVFLLGGGWNEAGFGQTYGRFLHAATRNSVRRIAIIVAEEPDVDPQERFVGSRGVFEMLGAQPDDAYGIFVSADKPLAVDDLATHQPTGIFVCGGLTPAYQAAICQDLTWLDYLRFHDLPYAGFSAGAAIAASTAIVGGWQIALGDRTLAIAAEETGEDLDLLATRQGLGLVPFAVDVHASQWGTLTRLVHSVAQGRVVEGWAIDEDTMLQVDGLGVQVYGLGSAYHVVRGVDGGLKVTIAVEDRA